MVLIGFDWMSFELVFLSHKHDVTRHHTTAPSELSSSSTRLWQSQTQPVCDGFVSIEP